MLPFYAGETNGKCHPSAYGLFDDGAHTGTCYAAHLFYHLVGQSVLETKF